MRLQHVAAHAPDLGVEPPDWTGSALCAQMPSEMFFVDRGGDVRPAKQVCGRCTYRTECLAFAMTAEAASYRYGIYGGLSADERHTLAGTGWRPGDPTPVITAPLHGPKLRCPHCTSYVLDVAGHVARQHTERANVA